MIDGKLYKPDDIRNPYFGVIFLFCLILTDIFILIYQFQLKGPNILFIIFLVISGLVCSYLIYSQFSCGVFVILTNNSIVAKNSFNKRIGEIQFDSITEIIAYSRIFYDIRIKDEKGVKIIINTVVAPIDELINEIIVKAVNCKKIDLRRIKEKVPGLSTYERRGENTLK